MGGLQVAVMEASETYRVVSHSSRNSAPITVYFVYAHNWLYTGLCLAVAALVVWCHRENIQRLLHGTEKKFKWHVNPMEGKDPPQ